MDTEKISKDIDSSKSVSNITICPRHKLINKFIHLIPSWGQVLLKCTKCVISQKIEHQYLLPFDEVKQCEDNTIFDSWPFFYDNNKVTQIFDSFVDENKIRYFFKGFRSEIIDQIDKIEENYIAQHKKLQENKKILIEYYNKVSLKKQLKESVNNLEKDFDTSIKEIEKILKNDIKQIQNSEKIKIQLINEQFMHYNDYLSIENMNIFKLEIKKSLNLMNEIVNQEIVEILKKEESSSKFQINQNKNYLNNKVFYCSKQFSYSEQQLLDNQIIQNQYQLSLQHNQNRQISLKSLKDNKAI